MSFLQELKDYNPPGYRAAKAERIAQLCVKHGHIAWAVKILQKDYGRKPQSDSVIAFGFCLKSQQ